MTGEINIIPLKESIRPKFSSTGWYPTSPFKTRLKSELFMEMPTWNTLTHPSSFHQNCWNFCRLWTKCVNHLAALRLYFPVKKVSLEKGKIVPLCLYCNLKIITVYLPQCTSFLSFLPHFFITGFLIDLLSSFNKFLKTDLLTSRCLPKRWGKAWKVFIGSFICN